MVFGPLAEYHLVPDSVIGTLIVVATFVGIYYAYTGAPLRGRHWSAMAVLFGTNLVCFVLQGIPFGGGLAVVPAFYSEALAWTALAPGWFVRGYTWWSPFTSMFLHAGLFHIIGNMLLFWILGIKVEQRVGRRQFVVLYLAAGLFADLVTILSVYLLPEALRGSILFHLPGEFVRNLGASGAVYGLVGFSIFAFPKERILVPTPIIMTWWPAWAAAIFYVLFNLYIGLADPGVAWWAHLAGMLIGAVWGWSWRVRGPRRTRIDATTGWGSGGPVQYTYTYRHR